MGFDVKAAADQVILAVDQVQSQAPTAGQVVDSAQAAANQVGTAIAANPGSFISYTLAAAVLMSLAGIVWRTRQRLIKAAEEGFFSNWRLALLGTTGVVLSLASGYTTWDGMRNFTNEAVLSLMVTFGIQGIMLIVAWLIGESFAIGMNQQASHTPKEGPFGLSVLQADLVGAVAGIALFVALLSLILGTPSASDVHQAGAGALDWGKISNRMLIIVTGLLGVAFIALLAAHDLVKPYLQAGRVVIKNSVLWVMFLACMSTSVFFSFDSLFGAIFPQSERVRAAELRAQNQVAGIVADIEGKITESRLEEAQALFHTPGWETYDTHLSKLDELARDAQATIDTYWTSQIEERNRSIKQQQERISTAQGGQAGLAGKKTALGEELNRLKGERPELAAEFAQKKADVETKSKDVDAKRVEAMAEAGGVEGTGKEGHGPVYRQRMDELAKLQATVKIAEERFNDAKKRLTGVETRITSIEREQSALDGDLAKLKGEAETAEQRIKLAQEQLPSDASARIDPSRVIPAFESAKAEFHQDPTADKLSKLQQICTQIHTAMSTATPQTKKAVAGIDCDPKQAAEAASIVFALNAGSEQFGKTCKGGERLNQYTSADALFGFARKCLADSGLPSKETEQLRTRINFIELNRDDRAHRFVVTWNAFQDGNRLAYLALAIAIAMDGLVFMSGLFGANAVRSPLSDVPSRKARSAQQLEATINAALGKLPYETASLVLTAMRPITNTDGFSGEITLDNLDKPTADRIRTVLTAGSDIHAVEAVQARYQGPREVYRVRSELREYLSSVCDRHFKADKTLAVKARLEQVIAAALKPHIHEHSDIVIGHLSPMKPVEGYTSTVSLASLEKLFADAYDARIIRRVMNAGATVDAVAPDKNEAGRFYVRPDLYEALLMLSAHSPRSPGFEADRRRFFSELAQRSAPQITDGGALSEQNVAVPPPIPQKSLFAPEKPQKFDMPGFLQAAANPTPPAQHSPNRQQDFVASLVAALGVNPNAYFALAGPAFGAALAAADTFGALRRSNPLLDKRLTDREGEADNLIVEAEAALMSTIRSDDEAARDQLRDAFNEVQQNYQVLMLMPGGPFERKLADVIHHLEPSAGEGSLAPADQALLDAARRLKGLLTFNPRNSDASWGQLEAAFNAPGAPSAGFAQGNGGQRLG